VLSWQLATRVDPPFDVILSFLAIHNKHFLPFMRGSVHVRDIVYYVSVTFFFLLLTRQVLAAKRWT
jgi:ABC-2 type transport system permease protein